MREIAQLGGRALGVLERLVDEIGRGPVAALGGRLVVDSPPNSGTVVAATLPATRTPVTST